jgi:dTDP-4-dehydrorhamnose reductase
MGQTIVLIGANGQLGTDIVKVLEKKSGIHLIKLTHKDMDICDQVDTRRILVSHKPDIVINTAAFHKTDECEDNPEKAFQVNSFAVRNLAMVCRDLDAVLVHLSTDYVFGGDKERKTPYTEDERPFPLSAYGVSKVAGEYFVQTLCPKYFVVRSSALFGLAGSIGKGGNFVETMLKLAREEKPIRVVNDQFTSPTFTEDLAMKIVQLIETKNYGLYHITNNGECSWFDFAKTIFELSNLSPDLQPTTTEAFGARANRPRYSVLARKNLASIGLDDMRSWKDAVKDYLEKSRNRK